MYLDLTTKQQLEWVGKVVRMPESKIPKQLLMSWTKHPRKSPRNTYAQAIYKIIPLCNPIQGITTKTWAGEAKAKQHGTNELICGGNQP